MKVIKRDGSIDYFDQKKIEQAIMKAGLETGEMTYKDVFAVSVSVTRNLMEHQELHPVEVIQDMVEYALMEKGFHATAKAYILFRHKRTEEREARRD